MNPEFYDNNTDLLIKYLLGEATPEEAAQVTQWIAAHPEHQKQWEHFQLIWQHSRKRAVRSIVDEETAWQRMKSRLQQSGNETGKVYHPHYRSWLRIAALFVVLAGAALLAREVFQKKPVQTLAVQTANQVRVDTLPDGSVVTLNKHSQIVYPEQFRDDTRTISLQGEAFFNVTPNKDKPFLIRVNDVTVKVIGTSFNVRSEGGKTEVVVETGVVQVIRNNKVAELKPKERIVVAQQDSALVKKPVEDQLYNYYRTKEFVCDHTPLWKLVEVLNEAYDSHIVIERKSLRNQPLTTTFRNEPLDNILAIISQTLDVEVVRKENEIILQ